jgi:predicted RecA/RadA family phage recombinase
MAKNIVNGSHMKTTTWTNGTSADVSSGDIVVLGATSDAILAVAIDDIADGATGVVGFDCGVTAAKVSAAVFKKGESLTWDASASAFDDNAATPAAGDVAGAAARADADGANLETTCSVWLTGIPGALTGA